MPAPQARYFLLTIRHRDFTPYLPPGVSWIRGQLELGEGGYLHWQVCISLPKKKTLRWVKSIFGDSCHVEITRSEAAEAYVWKEETRVPGTQFDLGSKSLKRNSAADWELVWDHAKCGRLEEIPADIRVRNYFTLRAIGADFAKPLAMERSCNVFWGPTGTGKSRRAWAEAGMDAYPKDPRTKWWTGYKGSSNVVIDEFRGDIDVAHMLRWLDRYPVCVEIKGGSVCLGATNYWITSNLHPRDWYPLLDQATKDAFLRRLNVTEIPLILQ